MRRSLVQRRTRLLTHFSVAVRFLTPILILISAVTLAASDREPLRSRSHREPLHNRPQRLILDGRVGVIQIQPMIRLQNVELTEIVAGARYQALAAGSWSRGASPAASRHVEPKIVRTIPAVWRMRVRDEHEAYELNVRYELTSPDGRVDRLGPADGSGSEIRTTVRSLPPTVVAVDDAGAVIEGGMVLYLELDSVRRAGSYSGTLTVTLDHF
jgi:hypothetical protein